MVCLKGDSIFCTCSPLLGEPLLALVTRVAAKNSSCGAKCRVTGSMFDLVDYPGLQEDIFDVRV